MFPKFRNWLAEKLAVTPEPKAVVEAPAEKPYKVTAAAVARTAAEEQPFTPFTLPDPPPGVVPQGAATMAMDTSISSAYAWAEGGAFAEGIGFLGYPYLAELSQRPEYRSITEIIAQEMTRKWIKLISTGDDDKTDKLAAIESELKRLKVQSAFRKAIELDGFFGRSHIYLDTGDGEDNDELKTPLGNGASELTKAKVNKRHPLKRLAVIEPIWTYPNAYNANDPLRQDYYNPTSWFVQGRLIHATRLLTFVGRKVPDLLKPAYSFGGLSLSQIAKPYVDNWLRTRQSVSDLLHNFSILVLRTNLSTILQGGAADDLVNRAQLFNQCRDNQGLMMVDKDTEEFTNIAVPLGSLDKLQAQAQEHMSSVSGIPLIKLLGITPSGLNTSSEGEFESFNARIEAKQEAEMTDNLSVVINLVQLSLFNEIDPEIGFVWEPLGVLDESELAATRKTEAETDDIYVNMGALNPAEVRTRIAADEDSAYASIDVSEVPEPPIVGAVPPGQEDLFGEEPTGKDPDASAPQRGAGSGVPQEDRAAS